MTYPLEKLPLGWHNAEVSYRTKGQIATRIEVIDSNGVRYLHDPMKDIALKCALLASIGIPLYLSAYTLFHMARLPIATLLNASPTIFAQELWKIVKIPFYFIALECAALYGVFKPLEGRVLFGRIERSLHEVKSRREGLQYQEDRPPLEVCWDALSQREYPYPLFLGFCMQPIGRVNDPHVTDVQQLN